MKRFWVLLVLVLCLPACTNTLEKLRQTRPVESLYHKLLAQEYLELSESEERSYDWFDASYFAEKGLLAAQGGRIEPEHVENWNVGPVARPVLVQARRYLMDALEGDTILNHPRLSAQAVFLFDCWIEEQEENWQLSYIESCREDFYKTLDSLLELVTAEDEEMLAIAHAADQDVVEEQIKAVELPPVTLTYLVFFDSNTAVLSAKEQKVIDQIAADITSLAEYRIVINGHADREGTEEYNITLSRQRADKVKLALLQAGIASEHVQTYGFGESDPRVVTDDGVSERANRRVEIVVKEGKSKSRRVGE